MTQDLKKTWVFWLGLIITAISILAVFSSLYVSIVWPYLLGVPVVIESLLLLMVPGVVGGVVFAVIGIYMMYSGRVKETK
ncbi:MAG: hypothetical protein ACFFA1_05390 [Promethearchaeota archaeon]